MVEEKKLTQCFIAIDFSSEVIKEVARVQEVLGKQKFTGKMTELENLHLTLKFLGEIDDSMVEKVREKLKGIKFNEFDCKLCEIGTFSLRGNPRIVWIKVCGEGVWELQKKVDLALEGLFPKEERFMSHLTIARLRYVADKKGFVEHVKNIGLREIKFKVSGFELKSSELKSLGPVYRTIEKYENKTKQLADNN